MHTDTVMASPCGDGRISYEKFDAYVGGASHRNLFRALDSNNDGFLIRAELRAGQAGGCFGPDAAQDGVLFGIAVYILLLFDALVEVPRQLLQHLLGGPEGEEDT